MKQIFIISAILLFASCAQNSDKKTIREVSSEESKKTNENLPVDVGLDFVNSYVDNCNKMKESVGVVEWVNSNNLTTNRFKKELKTIVDEANKRRFRFEVQLTDSYLFCS